MYYGRMLVVLGIESSCDETAAAAVREDGLVLSSVVASQVDEHRPFGGVVPEVAARAHLRVVSSVVRQAIEDAGEMGQLVSVVAGTLGPGLSGALLVGSQFAKSFAWSRGLPFVGVDHLKGHLLSPMLWEAGAKEDSVHPPYIALLVSGGHTALYKVNKSYETELLGQTRDDAAGEALDKAAKVLGLPYPGGPVIDALSQLGDANTYAFPRPMSSSKGADRFSFSFSGLKTALVRLVESRGIPEDEQSMADLCASYFSSIVDVLVAKSVDACEAERIDTLTMVGGVASSKYLGAKLRELCANKRLRTVYPPPKYCTDNAAMIALAGAFRFQAEGHDGYDTPHYSRSPARLRGRFRKDGTFIGRRRKN